MSDTQGSTFSHEELRQRFQSNPVGFRVQLEGGARAVVREYRDTPRGRWYRLARRGWVPATAVEGFIVDVVGLRRPPASGALA